jgi:hypothetical protein
LRPKVNERGVLINPDLHDGLLVGLVLSPPKSLTLVCKTVDGTDCNVVVTKIEHLRADNFLQGNIIFEICIYEGRNCSLDALKKLYAVKEDQQLDRFLPDAMAKIIRERWSLLELGSSYGCELLALSREPHDRIIVSVKP